MKIAAQMYTIREFTKTPEDIGASLKKLSDIGYEYAQASGLGPIEPQRLRELADANNIKIVVTHSGADRMLQDPEAVMKDHEILGCKHLGVGSLPERYQTGIEGYKSFIRDFNPIAKAFGERGMKFHYHNHHFEYEKIDGQVLFDILVNESDPQNWGFIIDTYWVQVGGRCPARQIELLKNRADVIHVKDLAIVNRSQRMAPVYEGTMDFDEILDACAKANVEYLAVEQDDTYGMDPFEALAISYRNLKRKLG